MIVNVLINGTYVSRFECSIFAVTVTSYFCCDIVSPQKSLHNAYIFLLQLCSYTSMFDWLIWFGFDRQSFGPSYRLFRLAKKEGTIQYGYRRWGTYARGETCAWEQQERNKAKTKRLHICLTCWCIVLVDMLGLINNRIQTFTHQDLLFSALNTLL